MEYLLIPALSLLHFVRGRGWLPKMAFTALAAISVAGQAYLNGWFLREVGLIGVIALCGIALWVAPGVGIGFRAFHGRAQAGETEIEWLDGWADLIAGTPPEPEGWYVSEWRQWGTVWMSLRGLFALPLFLALFWANPWAPAIGLGMALQGPIYGAMRYIPEKQAVMVAEILTGAWLGFLLTMVL